MSETTFTIDPAWPWSDPNFGLPALGGIALLLIALTVWTYLGVRGASFSRVLVILALRLAALLIAVTLVLRPSLASYRDEDVLPSKLIVLVDSSASMQFLDEFNGLSRWQNAQRILGSPVVAALFKELGSRHKVEVVYYQGAENITKFNPEGSPNGKRTDVPQWLHELLQKHALEDDVRALAIISDGANNGTRSVDDLARQWGARTPLHTFAAGKTTNNIDQDDLALVDIAAEPSPVPVKGKLKVKAWIDAPKFVNTMVKVSLFVDGKPALPDPVKHVQLTRAKGNVVEIACDAPSAPGEIKVTMKVDKLVNEVTDANNEISTFVNVTKDGVSILWVEGKKRAFESVFAIRHALSKDPRFRVFYTERLREERPAARDEDWFNFDRQHYDVIVIGDVSADRFAGGNLKVFAQIKDLVQNKGTGLMMLGGYETFGNSDWHTLREASDLVGLLPVTLAPLTPAPLPRGERGWGEGQFEGEVQMMPTPAGYAHYLLRLADDPAKNKQIWTPDDPDKGFGPLDGMTRIGQPKQTSVILANRDEDPLLVGGQVGEGRVLAFGGDTTWKAWRRNADSLPAYERFWKQTMLWLARQEQIEGNVWVKLDRRRLAADGNQRLAFSVGIQGKGGVNVKDARYEVKVLQPDKEESPVPVGPEGGEERGAYFPRQAGEYVVEVTGTGKDVDGSEIRGTARARFLAYAEDLEKLRPAADHAFLTRLAELAGDSRRFHRADENEFRDFLQSLATMQKVEGKTRPDLWPDWRRNPASTTPWDQIAALWNSAALACFLVFTSLLCVEWFLRRRWGLV